MAKKTIGMRITEARKRKGLNRLSLSRVSGIPNATIRGWEERGSSPAAERLPELAEVLEVSLEWLLGLTDEPGPAGEGPGKRSASPQFSELAHRLFERFEPMLKKRGTDPSVAPKIIDETLSTYLPTDLGEVAAVDEEGLVQRIADAILARSGVAETPPPYGGKEAAGGSLSPEAAELVAAWAALPDDARR